MARRRDVTVFLRKYGPSSGSGLSKSASTCNRPLTRSPSSATSGPGTNSSTSTRGRSGSRRCATSGERTGRPHGPARAELVPIVGADHSPASGQDQWLHHARVGRAFEQAFQLRARELGRHQLEPWDRYAAARSFSRLRALFRAAATASGGLCGSPSFFPRRAPRPARSDRPPPGRQPGSVLALRAPALPPRPRRRESGGRRASPPRCRRVGWHTSLAAITSTPRRPAAARKSSLR